MNDILKQIINKENIEKLLTSVLDNIYINGPTNRSDLETLSFIKFFHPDIFKKYEYDELDKVSLFDNNFVKSALHKNNVQTDA